MALGAEATHIHSQAAHYFIVLYSQYLLVYYAGVMKVLEQLGIVKPGETSCMRVIPTQRLACTPRLCHKRDSPAPLAASHPSPKITTDVDFLND